jgi:hypothetical protein
VSEHECRAGNRRGDLTRPRILQNLERNAGALGPREGMRPVIRELVRDSEPLSG